MEHANLTIRVSDFLLKYHRNVIFIGYCMIVNSAGCASDYVCIDTLNNYKCILMIPSTSLNVVGREASTDYCIPEQ